MGQGKQGDRDMALTDPASRMEGEAWFDVEAP